MDNTPEQQEKEVTETTETSKEVTELLPNLRYGYIVGVREDTGDIFFKLLGGEKGGIIELLGTHQYASHMVQHLFDLNQNYGTPLLAEQNKSLAALIVKLITAISTPPGSQQSDNRIISP